MSMIFTDHSFYTPTVRSSRIWAQNGTVVGVTRRIFNNVSFNSMNVLPESSLSFVIVLLFLWSDTAYKAFGGVTKSIDIFSIISFIGVAIDVTLVWGSSWYWYATALQYPCVTAPHIIDKVVVVANVSYC